MVAIFRLERIQVKGEIVRIVTRIHREDRRSFRDQKIEVHMELCTI